MIISKSYNSTAVEILVIKALVSLIEILNKYAYN